MNLEPAMLLMIHSLPKYASLTVKLLEFLFHTVDTFDPPRREQLARGVTAAMVRYCYYPNLAPLPPRATFPHHRCPSGLRPLACLAWRLCDWVLCTRVPTTPLRESGHRAVVSSTRPVRNPKRESPGSLG